MNLPSEGRERISKLKSKIMNLSQRIKTVNEDLGGVRAQIEDSPPPEEFSQKWAQMSRALTRRVAGLERDRLTLQKEKTGLEEHLRAVVAETEKAEAIQLRADKVWYEKRREDHLRRKAEVERNKAQLIINPVLTDLRARVVDEGSYDRVKKAVEDVQTPEILSALKLSRPEFGVDTHVRRARVKLGTWEAGRPATT